MSQPQAELGRPIPAEGDEMNLNNKVNLNEKWKPCPRCGWSMPENDTLCNECRRGKLGRKRKKKRGGVKLGQQV